MSVKPSQALVKLFDEARNEMLDEKLKVAKERVKSKLRQLAQAELAVANLKREIEDLRIELGETL